MTTVKRNNYGTLRQQFLDSFRIVNQHGEAFRNARITDIYLQSRLNELKWAVAAEERREWEVKLADLQSKWEEADSRSQRALSVAQQTKRGHVYIISNIGSFVEDVIKIGMTRRLDPMDRVKELGDASVPFNFDVHAMIYSEDAPKLEGELHKHFR